jgi:cation diffusion facilitator CzcD-associated flavoprotein CzcO
MTSVELPGANPAVLTNGYKTNGVSHKQPEAREHDTGNDHITYTNGAVKEALAYSGRGRPLRVVIIGAGAAGIMMAAKLPRYFKNGEVELQVYEKNHEVGGTWLENRYPGCACDVPSHLYAYTFAPNPNWSYFYSGAKEIHDYFIKVTKDFGCYKYMKFNHKVTSAIWNDRGQWDLKIQPAGGEVITDYADILINANGLLNSWKWPNIKGFETYKGPKIHSANWDYSVPIDSNTTVAVIGNGSSAIQIVPQMQAKAKKVITFIRTKTWITPHAANSKAQATAAERIDTEASDDNALAAPSAKGAKGALYNPAAVNPKYSEQEKQRFRDDPEYQRNYRRDIEHEMNMRFVQTALKDSPGAAAAIKRVRMLMEERLAAKPELRDILIPEWNVGCRRPTPGIGYLEALCSDNVDVVTAGIERITENGIVTNDGVEHKIDVLVCGTGFDITNKPRFEMRGLNGYQFDDKWAASPTGYLSICLANMPNYFLFNGPNAPFANGSLLPSMEKAGDYMIRMIEKMYKEDLRSFCVKQRVVDEFATYSDAWMPRSVWTAPCRSWFKNHTIDGRVHALWPGSVGHLIEVFLNPRYEDFEYTTLNRDNRFTFLGNGLIPSDADDEADRAWYIDVPGLGC